MLRQLVDILSQFSELTAGLHRIGDLLRAVGRNRVALARVEAREEFDKALTSAVFAAFILTFGALFVLTLTALILFLVDPYHLPRTLLILSLAYGAVALSGIILVVQKVRKARRKLDALFGMARPAFRAAGEWDDAVRAAAEEMHVDAGEDRDVPPSERPQRPKTSQSDGNASGRRKEGDEEKETCFWSTDRR